MSKTIRNEKTKGYLDKLQSERRTRRVVRCLKADDMVCNPHETSNDEYE